MDSATNEVKDPAGEEVTNERASVQEDGKPRNSCLDSVTFAVFCYVPLSVFGFSPIVNLLVAVFVAIFKRVGKLVSLVIWGVSLFYVLVVRPFDTFTGVYFFFFALNIILRVAAYFIEKKRNS